VGSAIPHTLAPDGTVSKVFFEFVYKARRNKWLVMKDCGTLGIISCVPPPIKGWNDEERVFYVLFSVSEAGLGAPCAGYN
jgi:hypothetical protein